MMSRFYFFLASWILFACSLYGDPFAVYLTWQKDPLTTMTVQWVSPVQETESRISYRGAGGNSWQSVDGAVIPLPSENRYALHRAEITNLAPGSAYIFRIGDTAPLHKFRTMPKNLDRPVCFVTGGDMYHDTLEILEETNRQAAASDPHFALVGGDIGYAAEKWTSFFSSNRCRWLEWLKAWSRTMITPEGYLIPMLPVIGNHDVNGRYNQTPAEAPYFYTLFPTPGMQGYDAVDFSYYMTVFLLDSGHTHPVYGAQTRWLYENLEKRGAVPHKFAIYHVPAYPSVRKFKKTLNSLIRQNWVPLFERFDLTAAFENHEHTYKRSHPIYRGRVAPAGVLYMGDGAWGVKKPRKPKNVEKTWYLAKAYPKRHFIRVTLHGLERKYEAVDPKGVVFDSYEQTPQLTELAH